MRDDGVRDAATSPPVRYSTVTSRPHILITGGAGFIGSALASRLIAEGAHVYVVDNLVSGFLRNLPPEAEFIETDCSDQSAMREVFGSFRIDVVCHLAAQVSTIVSHRDPWSAFRTNVGGTINVLEEVRRQRITRLVDASTMALYGNPERLPVPEDAALRPRSPYGVSKLAAEHLVHNMAERRDLAVPLSVTSLRMFNVYGPGQSLENPYQGVAGVFIRNILAGEPVTIFGSGEQRRDFVFIDDVIDCWTRVLVNEGTGGKRINVGSGRTHTIHELLAAVLSAFSMSRADYEVVYEEEVPGDQQAIQADTRLARDVLAWRPRVDLVEGIEQTVAWGKLHWNVAGS